MKSRLKRISEHGGVCVLGLSEVLGRAGFRQVSIASVRQRTPVYHQRTVIMGRLRKSIRLILLSLNRLSNMAHILHFFWMKGHDKIRPKEICFRYLTCRKGGEKLDQLLGIMLRRPRGLLLRRRRCIMKKLTKRNRKHNRKVVFGYHAECTPEQRSNYSSRWIQEGLFSGTYTCIYTTGKCCDPD